MFFTINKSCTSRVVVIKYNLLPDKCVEPKVGLLALFPSYFWHGTEPFQSNENRLTVAFDVKKSIDKQQIKGMPSW